MARTTDGSGDGRRGTLMDRRTRAELRAVRWPLALVVLAALVAGLATLPAPLSTGPIVQQKSCAATRTVRRRRGNPPRRAAVPHAALPQDGGRGSHYTAGPRIDDLTTTG